MTTSSAPARIIRARWIPVRQQEVLARWLALKTLVADRADSENCFFGPDDFHAFY
jgi:hypothetical protein